MSFELPDLPYYYKDLEPVIDAETMDIHYGKHHQSYVSKLNKAVRGTKWDSMPIDEVLRRLDELPDELGETVRNNGGGHYNHSLFWPCLRPPISTENDEPDGALAEAIRDAFGSFDDMKREFTDAAKSRFGSGWAWLCVNPDRRLHIGSTANQDACIMPEEFGGFGLNHTPILGLDVWEHAYYLKHQNDRGAYIDGWWDVVNWQTVAINFAQTGRAAVADALQSLQ